MTAPSQRRLKTIRIFALHCQRQHSAFFPLMEGVYSRAIHETPSRLDAKRFCAKTDIHVYLYTSMPLRGFGVQA